MMCSRMLVALLTASLAGVPNLAGAMLNENTEQLVDILAVTKASYAVLLQQDSMGEAQPVCAIDLAKHPETVPAGMSVALEQEPQAFRIPLCSAEQIAVTARLAMLAPADSTHTAALAPAIGALCLMDFAVGAVAVATANVSRNRHLEENVTGFALGFGTASGVVQGISLASRLGLGAVGFLCGGAGVYVGYYLIPARRY